MSDTGTDIAAEVRAYLTEHYLFDRVGFTLADDASMTEHKVLDSLGVLNLITFLEQTYGITVLENEVEPGNLDSLAKIAAFVTRKRKG